MKFNKTSLLLFALTAVCLPLHAHNVTMLPRMIHEFYDYPMMILPLLISFLAGCALIGACVLSWRKHEYNVPRQKKWYEWLISFIILFFPYAIAVFAHINHADNVIPLVIVLCAAVGLVYELAYAYGMNREEIRSGKLRYWMIIEGLMIFACYSSILINRMVYLSNLTWFESFDIFFVVFIEYFIFFGLFFFFFLHRQKKRRSCYILLNFCTVTGLILLAIYFRSYLDGAEWSKVVKEDEKKKVIREPDPRKEMYKTGKHDVSAYGVFIDEKANGE